jgi:hypothetical protein
MRGRSGIERAVDTSHADAQNVRHLIPLAENRRSATTAESPFFAWRRFEFTQQLGTGAQVERRCRNRNVACKGRALRFSALTAMT